MADAHKIMQLCRTPLSDAFFSQSNVDALQVRAARAVKARTGHSIDRQSDREILGIMQGIFEAYSNNVLSKKEIARLNDIVLDVVVDQVSAGVKAYLSYLVDASTLPEPLARGTFASIKGSRAVEYPMPGVN